MSDGIEIERLFEVRERLRHSKDVSTSTEKTVAYSEAIGLLTEVIQDYE